LEEATERAEMLKVSVPTVVHRASISLQAKIPTKVLSDREAKNSP